MSIQYVTKTCNGCHAQGFTEIDPDGTVREIQPLVHTGSGQGNPPITLTDGRVIRIGCSDQRPGAKR